MHLNTSTANFTRAPTRFVASSRVVPPFFSCVLTCTIRGNTTALQYDPILLINQTTKLSGTIHGGKVNSRSIRTSDDGGGIGSDGGREGRESGERGKRRLSLDSRWRRVLSFSVPLPLANTKNNSDRIPLDRTNKTRLHNDTVHNE